MGVQGAWSLVSTDPRRFGETWICHDKSVVLIDGPSLMYFLIGAKPTTTMLGMHTGAQISASLPPTTKRQTSPFTTYTRTTNFLSNILKVCGTVHVVLDGLAPESKLPSQIARLKKVAALADTIARSDETSSNNNNNHSRARVPHILTEWAFREAVEDSLSDRLHLHRPRHGEAEHYIDRILMTKHGKTENSNTVVLSNDTDFLIYPNCHGFVPLESLQFQTMDGQPHLSGFHYLSCKFYKAFFPSADDASARSRILSLVAALSGCDYGSLEEARARIVQSSIAGLPRKARNNHSSANILMAVVRYVNHYLVHQKNASLPNWVDALAESLQLPQVRQTLDSIHDVYVSMPVSNTQVNSGSLFIETVRLKEQAVLICRPLIETWKVEYGHKTPSTTQRTQRSGKSRRGRRKRNRRQRLLGSAEQADEISTIDDQDEATTGDNLPVEAVTLPPLEEDTIGLLTHRSVWKLPVFVHLRQRLYGLLHTRHATAKEYARVGRGESVDFVEHRMELTGVGEPTQETHSRRIQLSDLQIVCLIAAKVLPPRAASLLILAQCAPTMELPETNGTVPENQTSLLAVAVFHAVLCRELVVTFASFRTNHALRISRIFHDGLMGFIWKALENLETRSDSSTVELCQGFFETLKDSRTAQGTLAQWEIQTKVQLSCEIPPPFNALLK